jgi:hypothetical protein
MTSKDKSNSICKPFNTQLWSSTVSRITSSVHYLAGCFRNIDDVIFDAIPDADRYRTDPIYKYINCEQLIYDASILLDRCVTYRREANELAILGVKAELEYETYCALKQDEDKSQKLALRARQSEIEKEGFAKSAALFEPPADPLAAGLRAQSETTADSAKITSEAENLRSKLIDARRGVLDALNETMHSRLGEPGNAHNFGDRWKRIVRLLQQDILVAYQKLAAAEVGLKRRTYHPETDLPMPRKAADNPSFGGIGFLDELVLWARAAIMKIDYQAQFETQSEVTIAFTSRFAGTSQENLNGSPPPYEQRDWPMNNPDPDPRGLFKIIGTYDLGEWGVFSGFTDVRLRYVNLAFCYKFETSDKDNSSVRSEQILGERDREVLRATSCCAWLMPPLPLGRSLGNNAIFLSNVRHVEAPIQPLPTPTEPLDPAGKWTIRLSNHFMEMDRFIANRPEIERVWDLRLILGFIGMPKNIY